MKYQETVEQFIQIRARGLSFARIAEQLGRGPRTTRPL
jgi:hypothetical protein